MTGTPLSPPAALQISATTSISREVSVSKKVSGAVAPASLTLGDPDVKQARNPTPVPHKADRSRRLSARGYFPSQPNVVEFDFTFEPAGTRWAHSTITIAIGPGKEPHVPADPPEPPRRLQQK